jgi:beta-galactosidase/beta-glucuronidase
MLRQSTIHRIVRLTDLPWLIDHAAHGVFAMPSRRKFLTHTASMAITTIGTTRLLPAVSKVPNVPATEVGSFCGEWLFCPDPGTVGTQRRWYAVDHSVRDWHTVSIPHTWQIEPSLADYRGVAWYRRTFDAPASWGSSVVRIEFEAVFHTASVWVNGQPGGEHARRGYTAFALDITHLLRLEQPNTIVVRVDNAFNEHMVPRGHSSDWAHDGGIVRPVQLLITPKTFVERVDVDALPDLESGDGRVTITAHIRNASSNPWAGRIFFRVVDDATGLEVLASPDVGNLSIQSDTTRSQTFQTTLPKAKLWHFDHPNLYGLNLSIANERDTHQMAATFGVRKLEVKKNEFYLNGERVRLMGVERMAGSNPEFGMAETGDWITRDHADLKHLNCVLTRTHWPQDRRVLDYCDRHGILVQCEVPAWGPDTFAKMGAEPDADIMENGLEQLRELIARDRNHPSVVVWGLCNEIYGQNPPAYIFAKRMLQEAKNLDPNRLCSYASNSLGETPQRDVAGLMDFIEANEYFGSWQPGSPQELDKHLESLHTTFPDKPLVISEYGYCACTEDRPEGDTRRIEILRSHDAVIRSKDYIGGAIFFCYNDYRTHVGNRGVGVLQQNVHGVVDVYGAPKPSYETLRQESSPIESLAVSNQLNTFHLRLKSRRDIPMYTLRGYRLRGLFYGQGIIPIEQQEVELPEITPGIETRVDLTFSQSTTPLRVQFDVLRPTRFSAYSLDWKP